METIDCRGLSCPQPVIETKKALEKRGGEDLLVLVDNPVSKENVCRFAESQGHRVDVTEQRGVFSLKIQRREPVKGEDRAQGKQVNPAADYVVLVESDSLGRGSEELGQILMRSFLHSLGELKTKPQRLIFINSGVKLACQGSEVLDDLREMATQGIEILSCGTCLDYFGKKKELTVGRISNMYEILDSLTKSGKVIKM